MMRALRHRAVIAEPPFDLVRRCFLPTVPIVVEFSGAADCSASAAACWAALLGRGFLGGLLVGFDLRLLAAAASAAAFLFCSS